MGFGKIFPSHEKPLKEYIQGEEIIYPMCGSGELAVNLLKLGAASVLCVDKHLPNFIHRAPGIFYTKSYVKDFEKSYRGKTLPKIAFVSWVPNHTIPGIENLLDRMDLIIYLGVNDDYTVCGDWDFWEYVRHRKVLREIPGEQDMIIYGEKCPRRTDVLKHEFYAHSFNSQWK